ncbi:uncharacterized protein [Dysidea avara]|uniref:uncharacterized protein n=1 Tax=Dysidea avara TaxID=196820 RepID=UPI003323C5F0
MKRLLVITSLLVLTNLTLAVPVEENNEGTEVTKTRDKRGDHLLEDIIAQASCAAYMPIRPQGWVYAVHRDCNYSETCAEVCASKYLHVQDSQTAERTSWRCIGGIHVYYGRPYTGDGKAKALLGLKTYFYGYESCGGGCGPNYCCCKVE